jgi:hypothetical protein
MHLQEDPFNRRDDRPPDARAPSRRQKGDLSSSPRDCREAFPGIRLPHARHRLHLQRRVPAPAAAPRPHEPQSSPHGRHVIIRVSQRLSLPRSKTRADARRIGCAPLHDRRSAAPARS